MVPEPGVQARRVELSPVNQSQRVVLVVALGLAMLIVGVTVHGLLYEPFDGLGLDGLTPGTGGTYSDTYFIVASDATVVRQALVWLGGVAIWTVASWRILRSRAS